jgi:hypothetical protein
MLPEGDRRTLNCRITGTKFVPAGGEFMDVRGSHQQHSLLAGGKFSRLRNLPCLR